MRPWPCCWTWVPPFPRPRKSDQVSALPPLASACLHRLRWPVECERVGRSPAGDSNSVFCLSSSSSLQWYNSEFQVTVPFFSLGLEIKRQKGRPSSAKCRRVQPSYNEGKKEMLLSYAARRCGGCYCSKCEQVRLLLTFLHFIDEETKAVGGQVTCL